MRSLLVPCALCAALSPLGAQSTTLLSTQVLRIHFSIPSATAPVPDVLELMLGTVTVNAAFGSRQAVLWDAGNLLGTALSPSFGGYAGPLGMNPANSWRQVGSPWTFDSPGDVANFVPLQSGAISGIIDFSLASGSMSINPASVSLQLLRAFSGNSGSICTPAPVVNEMVVAPRQTGPVPGTVNALNTWSTSGAGPGNLMVWALGFAVSPVVLPITPPVYFDLAPPIGSVLAVAGAGGNSSLQIFVPPIAAGLTVFTQAVQLTGTDLRVSNFVRQVF